MSRDVQDRRFWNWESSPQEEDLGVQQNFREEFGADTTGVPVDTSWGLKREVKAEPGKQQCLQGCEKVLTGDPGG